MDENDKKLYLNYLSTLSDESLQKEMGEMMRGCNFGADREPELRNLCECEIRRRVSSIWGE